MDEEIKRIDLSEVREEAPSRAAVALKSAPAPSDGPPVNPPVSPASRLAKALLVAFLVILGLGALVGLLVARPLFKAYGDAQKTYASAKVAKDAFREQDIEKIKTQTAELKSSLLTLQSDLDAISWTASIPWVGGYTQDARHLVKAGGYGLDAANIAVAAVEPYADILGLKGKGTFTGGTAEDRLVKAVETLDKVTPQVDEIAQKFALLRAEIDQVDPARYPESLRGKPVRSQLVQVKELVDLAGNFLDQARPMVKQLPELLGAKSDKKYLVLFQNDAELRPTGGFLTAYAIFRIEKGRLHIESSDDIYKLDDTIAKHVVPPKPISLYLNESVWHIRNANFSPDFSESMRSFLDLYDSSTDKKKIDGIIAMDTHVLLTLVNTLGPISAYGTNFTTEKVAACGCPMIIYELEKFADEPKGYARGSRKDIIGVLLTTMMQKTLSAPKQLWGPLTQAVFAEMQQKHVLFYLLNPEAEKGIAAMGGGGIIRDYSGDFLHISDANLGGAKSNLYVTQAVSQVVTATAKGTDTTLTIEYRYPHQADNCSLERKEGLCLAGIYRDYLRVYLPSGSTLVQALGFESKNQVSAELGKTVVDGFFTVFPLGVKKIQVKYTTPVQFSGKYQELIQKQPGTIAPHYKLSVNGKTSEFDLESDREVIIPL